jgi:hypothetical protein
MTTTRSKLSPHAIRQAYPVGHYLDAMERSGVEGEERNATILMLVGIPRVLEKPLNLIIKKTEFGWEEPLGESRSVLFHKDVKRRIQESSARVGA